MSRLPFALSVPALVVACTSGPTSPATPSPTRQAASGDYETIDLGTFDDWTRPTALNNSGQVVGWSGGTYGTFAFVWDAGTMRRLDGPDGPAQATADAITDDGVIAGRVAHSGQWQLARWDAGGVRVAVFPDAHWLSAVVTANAPGDVAAWSSNDVYAATPVVWDGTVVRLLGHLGPYEWTVPAAVNDRGLVVGRSPVAYAEPDDPDAPPDLDPRYFYFHPFLWDGGTIRDLGVFGVTGDCTRAAPCAQGEALDVNSGGDVVGFSEDSAFVRRPFLWRDGRLLELDVFPGTHAVARVINDRGQIAGDGSGRAFLWEDGSATVLGSLGGGVTEVTAINARGEVVGAGLTAGGEQHAFVWSDGRLTDLGLGLPGGEGSKAIAINDRGDVLGAVAMTCFRNTPDGTCNYSYNRSLRAVLWRRRGGSVLAGWAPPTP